MTNRKPPTRGNPPRNPPKVPTTPPSQAPARPKADPPATVGGERHVTLAVVIGAHGVTGEVRLKVFGEDLASYGSFNGGALTMKSARPANNGTIARFAEVTDRSAAEALRGTELTIPRSALPPLEEGEYYHVDLLGLPAISAGGEPIGRVAAIDNFGAGDVIEIERSDGKRFMVPMRPEAVPEWNAERLVVADDFIER